MNKLSKYLTQDYEKMLWANYHSNVANIMLSIKSNQTSVTAQKPQSRSLLFTHYPSIKLKPTLNTIKLDWTETLLNRRSSYDMRPDHPIDFNLLSNLLVLSYQTRKGNKGSIRRTIASAGALYPIDIYVHTSQPLSHKHNSNLSYYDVDNQSLRLLNMPQCRLADVFQQTDLFEASAIHVFLTINLEDTLKKYGEKGYQLALLEAGHIAQNFNLVATALKLPSVNICGFNQQALNKFLLLDGLVQSAVYCIFIG